MQGQHQAGGGRGRALPIAIIGAGFAGIGMGIALQRAGFRNFTIFERAGEIGGTWRDNTYPGAACDVPAYVYSFSFEPNPDWSRLYATSGEIQGYLLRCVEKYGLRPHLRLGCEITSACFDEGAGRWTLGTAGGESHSARVVLAGVGGLVDPKWPDVEGIQGFGGEIFHTARWNHDCDLTGRSVAVIGTGASAVQVVPAIAGRVAKLSVFQRTPAWVMPKADRRIDAGTQRFFARHPLAQKLLRWGLFWLSEATGPIVFLDSPLSKIGERASLRHLAKSVSDPELRRRLTPTFQFGCKRVLISNDYWSSFERENVELVTAPIAEVHADAVETRDGRRHEVDAIVLATGFALGLANAPFAIRGLAGRTLDDAWRQGATAYKGMAVSGFPNWFIMMGPNTGPGHTSVLVYTEHQFRYILQALEELVSRDLRYLHVRPEVQDAYNEGLQRRMRHMAWSSGCQSWYLNPDGSNHALYPGFASEYCARTRRFRPSEYHRVPARGGAQRGAGAEGSA
jgi:cation diffusion facilitator CzcD-associated flavoprotein CzcO